MSTGAVRIALVLIMGAAAAPAAAQLRDTAAPGDRIRGEYRLQRVEGRLLRADDRVLVVHTGADTLLIPLPAIAELERHAGQRRNTVRGLFIGGAAGMLGGALVGAALIDTCSGAFCFGPRNAGEAALGGALVGTAGGLVLGAILGATSRREVWVPAELPASAPR